MQGTLNPTVILIYIASGFMVFGQVAQSLINYASLIGWSGFLITILGAVSTIRGKESE